MTDAITLPRALLEQALACLVRAEILYRQPNQEVQEALRSALEQDQQDPFAPALYTGQPIPEIEKRNKETVRLADPQDPIKAWGDAYEMTAHEYKTLWHAATADIEKLQQRIAELKAALEQSTNSYSTGFDPTLVIKKDSNGELKASHLSDEAIKRIMDKTFQTVTGGSNTFSVSSDDIWKVLIRVTETELIAAKSEHTAKDAGYTDLVSDGGMDPRNDWGATQEQLTKEQQERPKCRMCGELLMSDFTWLCYGCSQAKIRSRNIPGY